MPSQFLLTLGIFLKVVGGVWPLSLVFWIEDGVGVASSLVPA